MSVVKVTKAAALVIVGVLLLAIAFVLSRPGRRFLGDSLKAYVERKVRETGDLALAIGGLGGNPLSGITLTDVRVSARLPHVAEVPIAEADSVVVRYDPARLVSGRRIERLRVAGLTVHPDGLRERARRRAAAGRGGGGPPPIPLVSAWGVDSLSIARARVADLGRWSLWGADLDSRVDGEGGASLRRRGGGPSRRGRDERGARGAVRAPR